MPSILYVQVLIFLLNIQVLTHASKEQPQVSCAGWNDTESCRAVYHGYCDAINGSVIVGHKSSNAMSIAIFELKYRLHLWLDAFPPHIATANLFRVALAEKRIRKRLV